MAGMLQILTYLLGVYLVVKGIAVLQIALASNREGRAGMIGLGILTLLGCIVAAIVFANMQDQQAQSLNRNTPSFPSR
jgi:uncharacterized membrane protein HdeD (DUF308 family)